MSESANASIPQSFDSERFAQFFSRIIHDVRGPLGGLLSVTELLAEEMPEADRGALLAEMKRGIEHLLAELQSGSLLGKLLLGKDTLEPEAIRLMALAASIADSRRNAARERGIALTFAGSANTDREFLGRRGLIETAFGELIDNALKFSPRQRSIHVSLSVTASNRWRFEVTDTGPGLSAAEQAKLFHEFMRLTPRPLHGESSHGLGLALVSEIARQHGGKVDVVSELGKGSTFGIELPG